jgi:two-component system phosphate regulon sensor histidine kinase PhoR
MYRDDATLLDDAVLNINLETERLHLMVEKILRLAALEKYEFEFQAERLDVREVLLDMINRMKAKAERFQVEIVPRLEEAAIWADRESIGHIMINLLDNAIKYNVPGGQIIISNVKEGDSVIIDIADTGIGIPAEACEKIFEPFYTVNKDRSRQTGGTGLGLPLVKQLAESQDGSIELLKTRNVTTFRLKFPAV